MLTVLLTGCENGADGITAKLGSLKDRRDSYRNRTGGVWIEGSWICGTNQKRTLKGWNDGTGKKQLEERVGERDNERGGGWQSVFARGEEVVRET